MSSVIFDFDGTIADSFAMVIGIFHELTHRDKPLPADEIERLRGMSLAQAAKELRIQPWKIPFMVIRGRRIMHARMEEVQPHPGMIAAIRELHAAGHNLYIMSSNSVQNIQLFLEKHNLSTEFIKLYGSVGLLGKARVLKRVLHQNHLDPAQTYYVGDEVRDIEGAKRAGVKIISVAWGYNNSDILGVHKPDCLAAEPADIRQYLADQ